MSNVLNIEVRPDGVAILTMNRPEKLNAINEELQDALIDGFTRVRDDNSIRAAIITGAGRAFTSGHDLVNEPPEKPGRSVTDMYHLQATLWKPVIAAINGICMAQGGAIALMSDIRIAVPSVVLGWPQARRGIASISGPVFLASQVPLPIAMEILLTTEPIDATTAARWGLINRVVEPESLMPTAIEIAEKIVRNAPLALRAIKEATMRGLQKPLEERLWISSHLADRVRASRDADEGLKAFAEKRAPVWRGE